MSESAKVRTGSCACGAIRYRAESVAPIWYCHCRQCRNITGHYMAASQVALDQIEISGEPKWYYVNERSRHGFCPECGSQLFWRNNENDYLSVTGGSMDDASELTNKGHIFTGEKGAYYDIPEHEEQCVTWTNPEPDSNSTS
ncbi:MAG: GFA family protein [Pseudomonadota bacterium]